jgi:hypothetical protein
MQKHALLVQQPRTLTATGTHSHGHPPRPLPHRRIYRPGPQCWLAMGVQVLTCDGAAGTSIAGLSRSCPRARGCRRHRCRPPSLPPSPRTLLDVGVVRWARPAARHGPPSNITGCGGCEVGTTGRPARPAAQHGPPSNITGFRGCEVGTTGRPARPAARHGPPSNITGCGGCEVGTTGRPARPPLKCYCAAGGPNAACIIV